MEEARQNALVLFVLLGGFLIGAGVMIWMKKDDHARDFLSVLTSASDLKIKALLETPQGMRPLDLTEKPDVLPPYRLTAELKDGNNQYRDVGFTVDKDSTRIAVMGDGFDPSQKITLTINDKLVFENLAMDWSGRIELESELPPKGPAHVCLFVESAPPLDICHFVAKRRAI